MARRRLATPAEFRAQMARAWSVALLLLLVSMGIGVAGFAGIEGLAWDDAVLMAAMLLSGMGPTATLQSTEGKLFASAYALFSGVVFISFAALLVSPILHRFLHRFHLELDE